MANVTVPASRGLRLLSLDGGGIRGLSTLMILQRLMKSIDERSPPKPCDVFDMIGGTSTGGLIAIMLGRLQMTVDECISAYLTLCDEVFTPQRSRWNVAGKVSDAWSLQGRFDSEALEAGVKRITAAQVWRRMRNVASDPEQPPPDKIDELASVALFDEETSCRTFVCAVREEFSDSVCPFRTYSSLRAHLTPYIWEAARATSAATTFFDPITIGPFNERFVDGALGFNNPVNVSLDEAIDQWSNARNAIQCIVSIGTGEPHPGPVGKDASQALATLKRMATETEKTADRFAKDHPEYVQAGKYYRFNVDKGLEDVGLEHHKKINIIAGATARYLQHDDRYNMILRFQGQMSGRTSIVAAALPLNLNAEQISYLYKYRHEVLLEHQAPDSTFSNTTISLPTRLFTPEAQTFRFDEQWEQRRPLSLEYRASWARVLLDYHAKDHGTGVDPRRKRMAVFNATWYEGLGGLFLARIPVSEIWRFITSVQSQMRLSTGFNPYGVSVYILGQFAGEPLFRLDPGEAAGGLGSSSIQSEELARCIVGRDGLLPEGYCGEKFSNRMPGLERTFMPWVLFFTKISNRVFFQQQVQEAMATMESLVQILHQLWDHEDAIDLYDDVVPIKVLLKNYCSVLRGSSGFCLFGYRATTPNHHHQLKKSTSQFFQSKSMTDRSFEIEDALTLVKDATKQEANQRNFNASDWTAHFGINFARWICLALIINAVENIHTCDILSAEYNIMLEGHSDTCYIA